MVTKVDQDSMREANRKLMIQALFNADQTSRSEIAEQITLHKSTVTSIYREVEEAGYIEELGEGVSSKVGGRKPKLIRFNHNLGYIVTFDLGHYHLRYMVARPSGEMINKGELTIGGMGIEEIQRAMLAYVLQLGDLQTDNGLLGVGIAIHGVVKDNKITYVPYHTGLLDIDLAHSFSEALNVPVFLENEANLAAIYIRDYHDYPEDLTLHNFMAINIHDGIGAGIIQKDRLYRGEHGEAGEIGRIVMASNHWASEGFEHGVHLEDLYSEDALIERVAKLKDMHNLTRTEFIALCSGNDETALRLMHEWVDGIAHTAFNIIQYMDPEALFIHSRILAKEPGYYKLLVDRYHSIYPQTSTPLFFANRSVDRATLAGGVALVTRYLLDMLDFTLVFNNGEFDDAPKINMDK
jgi:predicted NBD/HSP70 family sugar kinase